MKTILQTVSQEQRRLLVELAFCAISHGLASQAYTLLHVFPLLIEDKETCIRSQILLLIGLQQFAEAKTLLTQLPDDQQAEFAVLLGK